MKKTTIITTMIILILILSGCADKKNTGSDPSDFVTPMASDAVSDSLTNSSSSSVSEQASKPDSSAESNSVSEKETAPAATKEAVTTPYVPITSEAEPEPSSNAPVQTDFVADLKIAASVTQLITVSAVNSSATVIMHEKDADGIWHEIHRTSGYTGYQGVGIAHEGSAFTPEGLYGLSIAFGIQPNPGTGIGNYKQVDSSDYWVDDPNSKYYNRFVSSNSVTPDWNSAEHIIDYKIAYAYCIAIDYNTDCVPGAGSAIFLHCSTGGATAGCVSVSESSMVFILRSIRPGCKILIYNEGNLGNY